VYSTDQRCTGLVNMTRSMRTRQQRKYIWST